jgi:hypothetical protein
LRDGFSQLLQKSYRAAHQQRIKGQSLESGKSYATIFFVPAGASELDRRRFADAGSSSDYERNFACKCVVVHRRSVSSPTFET